MLTPRDASSNLQTMGHSTGQKDPISSTNQLQRKKGEAGQLSIKRDFRGVPASKQCGDPVWMETQRNSKKKKKIEVEKLK